jgi:hypothetical protein
MSEKETLKNDLINVSPPLSKDTLTEVLALIEADDFASAKSIIAGYAQLIGLATRMSVTIDPVAAVPDDRVVSKGSGGRNSQEI